MSDLTPRQLPPDLDPRDRIAALRYLRVFGSKRLPTYLQHLNRLRNGTPWCVYVDRNGARYFTHFKRLAKPVKNPRSITGSQKFIARNDNSPAFLF